MKIIKGDLIRLALKGEFDVIVHGCNCFNTMGAGIARQVASKLPEATIIDNYTLRGDAKKLGHFTAAEIERGKIKFIVVNAYTQYGCNSNKINVDYDAIRSCFKLIKEKYSGKRIGYPLIGCGLAGGSWDIVSKIIDEELESENHTLVEYQP
jgi:O-acetyl-ADP-ribose deacetylase (regulator of RNase III)